MKKKTPKFRQEKRWFGLIPFLSPRRWGRAFVCSGRAAASVRTVFVSCIRWPPAPFAGSSTVGLGQPTGKKTNGKKKGRKEVLSDAMKSVICTRVHKSASFCFFQHKSMLMSLKVISLIYRLGSLICSYRVGLSLVHFYRGLTNPALEAGTWLRLGDVGRVDADVEAQNQSHTHCLHLEH